MNPDQCSPPSVDPWAVRAIYNQGYQCEMETSALKAQTEALETQTNAINHLNERLDAWFCVLFPVIILAAAITTTPFWRSED